MCESFCLIANSFLRLAKPKSGWLAIRREVLTWVRTAANFLIPFVVSNLGLLSRRGARSGPAATVGSVDDEH